MKNCLTTVLHLLFLLWMLLMSLLLAPFVFLAACWLQFRLRSFANTEACDDVAPIIIDAEKGRDYSVR